MYEDRRLLSRRASNVGGMLILLAVIPPLALALNAVAGPAVAGGVCLVYLAALILTVRAERSHEAPSRDPATGLPDRAAALSRLERIFEQRLAGSSQAAVFVINFAEPPDGVPERHQVPIIAIARLAQGLRRGDQFIRIGEHSLAAILGPSRGLTARAAESILARIEGMFREPLRLGPAVVPIRVSLGACLQHDAPRADARSWLAAAELSADLAAEEGAPRLFPSGATEVARSAWDTPPVAPEVGAEGEQEAHWRAAARSDDPAGARYVDRRRRA